MTRDLTYDELMAAVEEHGSQRKAAEALGIPRSTLGDRLRGGESFLDAAANERGFPAEDVSGYWVKSKTGSFYVRRDTSVNYSELRDRFLRDAKEHAPKYERIGYQEPGDHLLIIDPADVHFNKLAMRQETGSEYNIEIADRRMREGTASLVAKASAHGVSKIVLVLGNDILHTDSAHRKTTSGTPQDTVSQWWDAYHAAKAAYIACIEELVKVAPVHLVHCPSNHDYMSGWMLTDTVCSWFANHPNVTAEDGSVSIAHRKYMVFGQNLIGFTHGDGAKQSDLASLMQYEARTAWGQTKFSYWYTHHLHHKERKAYGNGTMMMEKDRVGVTIINSGNERQPENATFVEIVRSPSEADGWHDRNGYKSAAAIECFLHHPDKGQVARFTEHF